MDRMNGDGHAIGAPPSAAAEAMEFVRFCHRRRRVGWPELYDEMCAVAGRGLYRGYGTDDLAELGISFGLFQMPALAGLVAQVVAEDVERRRRTAAAMQAERSEADASVVAPVVAETVPTVTAAPRVIEAEPVDLRSPDQGRIRLSLAAGAGA
jgi:hypothetical protein